MKIQDLLKLNKKKILENKNEFKENWENELKNKIKKYNFENNLNLYLIENSNSFYYISSVINNEIENIIEKIIIKNNSDRTISLPYSKRKLQNYGGIVKPKILENKEILPEFLSLLINNYIPNYDKINLNHVLVNIYDPCTGIMAHKDGSRYFPLVFILSIKSHCIFNILKENENQKREIIQKYLIEPGSLLIFKDDIYKKYLHQIEDIKTDVIEFKIIKTNFEILESNINNLDKTELWKNIKSNNLIKFKENLKNKKINYEIIELEFTFQIFITLIREQRISLTFRNVN